MLRLAGISTPESRAERIYDLEKKIAQAHWTKVEQRQVEKLNNPVMKGELGTNMPGLDWAAYTAGAGIADQPRIVAFHPSALAGAAKLVQSEPLETWKDYMTFRTVASAASVLPKAFVEESFAFNGKDAARRAAAARAVEAGCGPGRQRPSVRRSGSFMWSAISLLSPRRRWMCSSPTSSRRWTCGSPISSG
jgi:predicted metalloendopeptidase